MLPEPLHPILVHFPIVLAAALPPLAVISLIALRRRRQAKTWLAVAIVAGLALLAGLAAQQAGEREEDRAEAWVPESALENHEENANRFVWSLGAVFGFSLLGLGSGNLGRAGRSLTLITLIPMAVFLLQAGGSGGDLVYEHGAASAYVEQTATSAERATGSHDDD